MIVNRISNSEQFIQEFVLYNRQDQFSHEGLVGLYQWLEDYSEGTGEPIEMDVIGLCCEFTEYENLDEVAQNYSTHLDSIEALQDITHCIELPNGGLVVMDF